MGFRNYLTEANDRVGKTILNQINALDKWALASWGAKQYVLHKDGIQFDVRGSKFRGRVIIKLNSRDLYDIDFGTIRKMDWKLKKREKDVYVDQLVNIIDNTVG